MSTAPEPTAPLRGAWTRVFGRTEFGLMLSMLVLMAALYGYDRVLYYRMAAADRAHFHGPWESFSSGYNIQENLLHEVAIWGLYAMGAAIVIIAGGIDLSTGSVIAFTGVLFALWPEYLAKLGRWTGLPFPAAAGFSPAVLALSILLTLVVGFCIGLFHTLLITRLALPPFVATLATLVGFRSAAKALAGRPIPISDDTVRALGNGLGWTVAVFAVVAVLLALVLHRTITGRHLYALGGNESAARLSGLSTTRLKLVAYATSGMLSALAGIMLANMAGSGDFRSAAGYELKAIAAAVVGGSSLRGGAGTIVGTLLGVLLLRMVINAIGFIFKGQDPNTWEGIVVGVVLILAVGLNNLLRRG